MLRFTRRGIETILFNQVMFTVKKKRETLTDFKATATAEHASTLRIFVY